MSSDEPQSSEAVCNFFRKPSKDKNIRKRQTDTSEDGNEDVEDQQQQRTQKTRKHRWHPLSTSPLPAPNPPRPSHPTRIMTRMTETRLLDARENLKESAAHIRWSGKRTSFLGFSLQKDMIDVPEEEEAMQPCCYGYWGTQEDDDMR